MFGIRLYQRRAALTRPEQLQIKQTMVSTNGEGERTEYYRLQADAGDGKTLTLAEGITGRDAAEALKQQKVFSVPPMRSTFQVAGYFAPTNCHTFSLK